LLPPPCEELTTSDPFRQRDARQPAGHDRHAIAEQDVRPQIDVTARSMPAVDPKQGRGATTRTASAAR
jgi:hypothetical protein